MRLYIKNYDYEGGTYDEDAEDEDKEYTMKQVDSMERRILSVDDEPMNNKIIAHIMQDEPMYTVVSATGGR